MSTSTTLDTTHTLPRQSVRYRCISCEVAWTSIDDEACWVCGTTGDPLRSALALREDDHLHLDFQ